MRKSHYPLIAIGLLAAPLLLWGAGCGTAPAENAPSPATIKAKVQTSIDQVQNDPKLPPARKAEIIAGMRRAAEVSSTQAQTQPRPAAQPR